MQKLVNDLTNQIKEKLTKLPEVAIILGSGLADFAESMEDKVVIKYDELNGMLKSKVSGHKNQFIVGKIANKTVICMQGRFHPYDGFNAKQVVLPIYIFKLLGVKTLIVTNVLEHIKIINQYFIYLTTIPNSFFFSSLISSIISLIITLSSKGYLTPLIS